MLLFFPEYLYDKFKIKCFSLSKISTSYKGIDLKLWKTNPVTITKIGRAAGYTKTDEKHICLQICFAINFSFCFFFWYSYDYSSFSLTVLAILICVAPEILCLYHVQNLVSITHYTSTSVSPSEASTDFINGTVNYSFLIIHVSEITSASLVLTAIRLQIFYTSSFLAYVLKLMFVCNYTFIYKRCIFKSFFLFIPSRAFV